MQWKAFALATSLLWVTNAFAQGPTSGPPTNALPPTLKSCIEQMIGIFENESTSLKYDEIEDLNDGHGYTAGRSAFTTKEGDLLQVIEAYDLARPNNALSGFIPNLKKVRGTPSTEGLEGLPAAWEEAASDPLFRQAQDQVSDELYYGPAMQSADDLHLQSPLAKLALYDAIIQHGVGEDSDSLDGIITAATQASGPPSKVGEEKWLMAFLTARKEVLLNGRDPETRTAWKESVGRVDEQLRLLKQGNLQLSPPLILNSNGTAFTVNCNTSSPTPPGDKATHSDELTPSHPVKDASFYHERGIAAYRNGDISLAIADFSVAIRLDPNFKNAYIDRGIAYYRMSQFNRAFADIAHAARIENSNRNATPPLSKASTLSNKN
jgi:chitosanase